MSTYTIFPAACVVILVKKREVINMLKLEYSEIVYFFKELSDVCSIGLKIAQASFHRLGSELMNQDDYCHLY